MNSRKNYTGIVVALLLIALWFTSLVILFRWDVIFSNPLTWLGILFQTHLFTGMFITAHDAMHGSVFPQNIKINHAIGKICTRLFMFNSYKTLRPKHYLHHRFAGTEKDPDYHKGNAIFVRWYLDFLKEYISLKQFILVAITYNLLAFVVPQANLLLFWVIPSVLSTLQLFYFGTYLPHRGEHAPDNRHRAHSQSKNHLIAFLTCYFFGYHYEHHDAPATPWWQLWRMK
ncbi:MAG: fatty acid desaturase [Bacteroidia bacterium]|nr:fatty acid desaturase [Bacteroidia bacterium]